jgi:ubiquinone/menaquinone biosynthesis C-methylase UbiE
MILGIALFVTSCLLIYWLLISTEGVYLGQSVVTLLYNLYASRYDRIKEFDPEVEERHLARPILEHFKPHAAPLVLDIGTGTGRLPITLLDQPDFQGHVVGIDHAKRMILHASRKLRAYGQRIILIATNGQSVPFSPETFDCVTLLEMLEFTKNPEQQLREAVRVLRPGGLLVTTRRRGTSQWLMPGKTHSASQFHNMLADAGLIEIRMEAWQVEYDLVWAIRPGSDLQHGGNPYERMVCRSCQNIGLIPQLACLNCPQCGTVYSIQHGIVQMIV